MPSFHIHTLGCKVNRAESDAICAAMAAVGWTRSDAATADLCIVNTCTVTGEADAKNRKVIRQLLRACGGPVLVTGCAVNVGDGFYHDLDARVSVERDKGAIPRRAARLCGVGAAVAAGAGAAGAMPAGRTRASVKVQDGCDNACTFCIVRAARGPARSVPLEQVVAEVNARAGDAPELVLAGIDLGAYRDGGTDLAGLVSALLERTEVGRVRITSVEPQSVTEPLIELLAESDGRVCRHLHLCLQSGSTRVLREMGRRYDAGEFLALAGKLKAAVPNIALSTDVIAGFPGETQDDFEQTCRLVEEVGFMRLHVFRYSRRPGTPAAGRADQVDPETIARRARLLQGIGGRLAAADRARRAGTVERVVVEAAGTGTSESYHPVRLDAGIPAGTLVEMALSEGPDALVGETAGAAGAACTRPERQAGDGRVRPREPRRSR